MYLVTSLLLHKEVILNEKPGSDLTVTHCPRLVKDGLGFMFCEMGKRKVLLPRLNEMRLPGGRTTQNNVIQSVK